MSTIQLPIRCDRAASEALLPDLAAALGPDPIVIDGSAVSQIGAAVLQLLLSARRSGGGAEITASPALREAAALAGLAGELFDTAGQESRA